MIFGKSKLELKLGIFVLCAIVVLFVFVFMIGDLRNRYSSYPVSFVFNFVNGVKVGAPVRFAGMDVGQIRSLKVVTEKSSSTTKIMMEGLVRNDCKIPVDSQVWVNTLGLLGEKYIEIMPGKNYASLVQKNGLLVGNDPMPMQEFGELAKSIAQKLDDSISEIQDVAGSLSSLTKNLDDGVSRIKNKEGTVGKLLYDDALYGQIEELVIDIKKHPWKLFTRPKERPAKK